MVILNTKYPNKPPPHQVSMVRTTGLCYRKLQTSAEIPSKHTYPTPRTSPPPSLLNLLLPSPSYLPSLSYPPLPPHMHHCCFSKVMNLTTLGGILLNYMAHLSCLLHASKVFLSGINLSLTNVHTIYWSYQHTYIYKKANLGILFSPINLAKLHDYYAQLL